ncbi:MAG: histidine phosphatase family protein [Proteobacteria bacterium]|nr:histidine phosphatase family protein [Pseudomonadota bacterium]
MKTLYLLRHAKSSWANPELKDFERPLSKRGTKDVPMMAARFLARGGEVACIICSPANRAKTTARLFAKNIDFDVDDIISNPELYFAGTPMFLKAASLVDEACDSAMLVGHNPAITEFVNEMANCDIDNVTTCGLVELRLPIDHWSDIETGMATLVEFDYPKKSAR